jgi:hypothetical protein
MKSYTAQHPRLWVARILRESSRHPAGKVYRFCANPEGQQNGRPRWEYRQPPVLRSWPLGRRSGCSSAEPYPPPRPSLIVA